MLGKLILRLRALFRRSELDRELDEEVRFHLEREVEENIRRGMSPEGARRAAMVSFGGVEQVKEECRDVRGVRLLEDLWQDLRYGLRMLRKNLGFTAVAITLIAIGIGVNTTIFSVVNSVLLRPLPFKDSDRLAWFWETNLQKGNAEMRVSPPTFLDWRDGQRSFEDLAAFSEGGAFTLTGGDEPERIEYAGVTANFFPLLGVQPIVGRPFSPDDDSVGGQRVAMLSSQLWRTRFGSDPGVIGRVITLDGEGYVVVGVAPPGFNYPGDAQVWVPLMPKIADALTIRGAHYLAVIGRLRQGVTLSQAEAEMNAVTRRIAQADSSYAGFGVRLVSLKEYTVGKVQYPLFLLLAAVGFVLLIACANVANLLLARTATRQREIAVRMALGAGRGRVVRQLLTESLLLALAGGALGLLLAHWGLAVLLALSPQELPRAQEITINWQVLGFALAAALGTAVIFGLAPALMSSRPDLAGRLKEGGLSIGSGVRLTRTRHFLVALELALSLLLLVGAGLMVKSFLGLLRVDPGFRPEGVISFRLKMLPSRYPEKAQQVAFFDQLLERVKALPGVRSAGLGKNLPVSGTNMTSPLVVEGRPDQGSGDRARVQSVTVDPGYFGTLGMRLVKGRDFSAQDSEGALPVAVINETLARKYFPGEEPVGKRLRTLFGRPVMRQIVGVVGDTKHSGPAAETPAQVFVPFLQDPTPFMTLVVRTDADTTATILSVRRTLLAIDKDQVVDKVAPMEGLLSESTAQPRFYTFLLGVFAAVALLMAAVGLHGIVSYSVASRTHEIGIRVALGAKPRDVLKLFLGQAARLSLIGIGIGLAAAFVLTRLLSNLLFGVSATDPLTFAVTCVVLIAVALAASYLPARRATRVDPLIAIRYE